MLRVVLCDDHPIFREGLRGILAEYRDIIVVDAMGSGAELLAWLRRSACDVVILDIELPDMDGLAVLKEMGPQKPAVIVLSMYAEEEYALRSLKAGARGYLEKAATAEELLKAIRKVAAGGRYLSPTLTERIAADASGDAHKPLHERLSERERQVLGLIARGARPREIAKELSLSPATVASCRSRILSKLKLRSTAELIRCVLDPEWYSRRSTPL